MVGTATSIVTASIYTGMARDLGASRPLFRCIRTTVEVASDHSLSREGVSMVFRFILIGAVAGLSAIALLACGSAKGERR